MPDKLNLTTPASIEDILERALIDHEAEASLRFAHRMALRRLQGPNANSGDGRRERRLWALVQLLNHRIMASRWDIVDLDEEITELERRANIVAVDNGPSKGGDAL